MGNNIFIGDNSSGMSSNENIIRHEADQFLERNIRMHEFIHDGHKSFIEDLRLELTNYYSVEYKMIYLDQSRLKVLEELEDVKKQSSNRDILLYYEKILFFLNQEIDNLPQIVKQNVSTETNNRTKVFISYSHADIAYLNDLKRHFKPLENIIEFWDDSKLKPGQIWKEEITKAINIAKVGVLLLSADFFNSDFINIEELPPLLKKADDEGATIIGVVLKPVFSRIINKKV